MISAPELRSVVDDIKRVAAGDYGNTSDEEAGSDGTQNTFGGRAYDIDRLHADDARDKVFVAILKALVARHNRPSSPKELATCIMKHEFTMLGGATPYATVSSRISQHFKRIFDQVPPRPPILGRVAHEKHTRKYFYYVASAAEQDAFHRKVRAGLIPAQPMPLVPPPSSTRKKPRCMVPAAAVELDHSPAIESRRSLSRRAVSAEVSEQPHRSTRSRALPPPPPPPPQPETRTRPRRTSYDGGCVRRTSEDEGEADDSNPYARKRYRSVRSAVAQAYPRRRSRAAVASLAPAEEPDEEEEDAPAAGKWRRQQQQHLDTMAHGEPLQTDSIGGDIGAVMLLDGMFGNGSPTVTPTKDDLAAVVAADLLTPGIDDSVVPLTCAGGTSLETVPIEQTDDPASPPVLFHGHTTTPADQSPRLLSSAGTSVATTAVDYDLSFHELMDAVMGAELMSVNELENLWATSNPADDASHAAAAAAAEATAAAAAASTTSAGLPTIPETPDEDTATSAGPSRLTQRLLALSTTDASGQKLRPGSSKPAALSLAVPVFPAVIDTVEPTAALVDNTSDHEEPLAMGSEDGVRSSKVILPDPFADIPASAMVDTTVAVSPRAVLTIVETVPVYMTVVTTTEPAGDQQGKWIVRRHRLLRLVENGYVNASSLLLAGGVSSAVDRSTVMSLEVGRFKWRRPQSKLYGTWIPLPRARALAATCSLNHKLGPFLNDNLESYFPAPLPTSFVRHVITPFFTDPSQEVGLGFEFQNLINSVSPHPSQSISRSSTFGATARGTPSPSIIQALSKSSSSYNAAAAAAAKAMFSSDPRHLQSFLQLLSADGPMLGTSAEAMAAAAAAAMAAVDEDCLVEQQHQPPPPSPAAESKESTGGVDAQCLSDAIASTMTQPTPVKKDPEEEENDDDGPELDDGDGLDLMSMVIPGHDIDMICSSTPPSPPPPPPTTPPRLRRSSTADGSSQAAAQSSDSGSSGQVRRAAGLNARLAQTMEAFGLSGAAKASLLLRLRAAAASTSTGRPQAVAPYLLYRSTAAKRKDESSVGVRKRARVVRVARSKPGEAEAPQQPPPPPPKRMIDAAAILRVACAIYSQKLNAGMQPPQPQQPEPPQPRPVPRPQTTVRPVVRPVRPAVVTPQRPLQPVSSPAKRLSPLVSRPPLPSPQARPGTAPVRRPMNGFQPRPPMSQPGGVPMRRPVAPSSGRPPLMRPPLRPPPPNGQLRPRPALPANGASRPPPLPMRPATAARPPLTPIKSPLGARPPPYSTPLRPGGMRPIMRPQPPKTD